MTDRPPILSILTHCDSPVKFTTAIGFDFEVILANAIEHDQQDRAVARAVASALDAIDGFVSNLEINSGSAPGYLEKMIAEVRKDGVSKLERSIRIDREEG